MGVYLSVNGWSDHVPGLLKQKPDKVILLLEGYALRCALARQIDWKDYLIAAVAHLNVRAEPHLSTSEYLASGG